ncbi:MAG TPA: 4'-phosphopantetheinyl transferase superfamily protein [Stellaceae bacterium]
MSSPASTRSSIPLLPAGECHVWWASAAAAQGHLMPLLDPGERERWSRFRREDDRARYLAAHALKRIVVAGLLGMPAGALGFSAVCRRCGGAHGKPRLQEPAAAIEFSLSHSGERVVLAVARGGAELGVDVERLVPQRDRGSLAPAVLSATEQRVVAALPPARRPLALLRYWTRKEALLKATGDGLAVAPATLTVSAPDAPPALLSWTAETPLDAPAYLFDLSPGPGHVASLAILGARLAIVERAAGDRLLTGR